MICPKNGAPNGPNIVYLETISSHFDSRSNFQPALAGRSNLGLIYIRVARVTSARHCK